MRLLLKLGRRSRSLGARGRGGILSIISGEVVYGIGFGEVAGGESTSAMFAASDESAVSGMRKIGYMWLVFERESELRQLRTRVVES